MKDVEIAFGLRAQGHGQMTDLTERLKELLSTAKFGKGKHLSVSQELAEMLAEALAPEIEKMMPRWIPVSERLPDEGQGVDVWGNEQSIRSAEFKNGKFFQWVGYHDDGYDLEIAFTVTHWMPIMKGPMG
jgi:hypothetical protein